MREFRRKPVAVEAVQLRKDTWEEMRVFVGAGKLSEGKPERFFVDGDGRRTDDEGGRIGLWIPFWDGKWVALEGDWIIKEPDGELFVCVDAMFRTIYAPVGEETK